jgi:hypothetical protein
MPHLKDWNRVLASRLGQGRARRLSVRIQERNQALLSANPNAPGRPLRSQLENLVLPGLALYLSLKDDGFTPQAALGEVDALFEASLFRLLRTGIAVLNLLPDPFPVVRPFLRQMTKTCYLPGLQEVVEDSPCCFAVNVYRCFILDTLRTFGAPELTPSFCVTDDWLAKAMPKVRWQRTMTLGRGGSCCDFRWSRRVTPSS